MPMLAARARHVWGYGAPLEHVLASLLIAFWHTSLAELPVLPHCVQTERHPLLLHLVPVFGAHSLECTAIWWRCGGQLKTYHTKRTISGLLLTHAAENRRAHTACGGVWPAASMSSCYCRAHTNIGSVCAVASPLLFCAKI